MGDHERGIRLGERIDELAAAVGGEPTQQLLQELPHRRAVAVDAARRQRRVDEIAQATVILAVDIDDVPDDLLVQRAVVDPEQLADRQSGEHGRLRAQEELRGLTVEHGEAERVVASQPSWPCSAAIALR